MRTATCSLEAQSLLVPRLMMAALISAMLQAAGSVTGVYGEEMAAGEWLKLDENGEPYEATLVDGTTVKLDTYNDEFEVTESRPPANSAEKGQTVLDYEKAGLGHDIGCFYLRLHAAEKRMYWIESGPSGICNIRSAALSGRKPKVIVELRRQSAKALALDVDRGHLYWANHAQGAVAFGKPASARKAVWRASLNGKTPEPVLSGLKEPGAIAVEPETGDLFYFDGLRLLRAAGDGTNEAIVVDSLVLPYSGSQRAYRASNAIIEPKSRALYWSHNESFIARSSMDGTGLEVLFDSGGQITAVAFDPQDEKIYWIDARSQEIWRANLDGSQAEAFVIGLTLAASIDLDAKQRYLYWTEARKVRNTSYALIRRLKMPPSAATTTRPAPPLVTAFEPARARVGQTVVLRGKHLAAVNRVRLIGDDGQQSDAKMVATDDSELKFILPPRRDGVKRVAVVAIGAGGVTVTLPRNAGAIKRGDRPITNFDRFSDGGKFCFAVEPGAAFANVEQSLVYAPASAQAIAGGRGHVVIFLKDGARTAVTDAVGVVVYHEPHAQVAGRARSKDAQYFSVAAIRPSFLNSLLEYQEKE